MKIELLLLCVKDHGDYPTQPASHPSPHPSQLLFPQSTKTATTSPRSSSEWPTGLGIYKVLIRNSSGLTHIKWPKLLKKLPNCLQSLLATDAKTGPQTSWFHFQSSCDMISPLPGLLAFISITQDLLFEGIIGYFSTLWGTTETARKGKPRAKKRWGKFSLLSKTGFSLNHDNC